MRKGAPPPEKSPEALGVQNDSGNFHSTSKDLRRRLKPPKENRF